MIRVAVVIVSYNTRALLRDCLTSLFRKTRMAADEFRVVVVDNASSDDSVRMVREEFPAVLCIEAGENLGFGRANNLGVERIVAECGEVKYLFFLNSDTLLLNDAVGRLADFLDATPRAAAAGGNLYAADGVTPAQSFSPVHGLDWELLRLMPNAVKRRAWPPETWFNYGMEPIRVGYISGADLMVRREALGGRQPFDPDFFMYYEDVEICVRLTRAGYEVWSVPEARIVHLGGQSCTVSRQKFERMQQAKYLYYDKTRGAAYSGWVYRLTQLGYRAHEWLGRMTGNAAKRDRYREWAEVNAQVWRARRRS